MLKVSCRLQRVVLSPTAPSEEPNKRLTMQEKGWSFIAPYFVICHAWGNLDGLVPAPDGLASVFHTTPPLDHCVSFIGIARHL